jgi:hypothetical protein
VEIPLLGQVALKTRWRKNVSAKYRARMPEVKSAATSEGYTIPPFRGHLQPWMRAIAAALLKNPREISAPRFGVNYSSITYNCKKTKGFFAFGTAEVPWFARL